MQLQQQSMTCLREYRARDCFSALGGMREAGGAVVSAVRFWPRLCKNKTRRLFEGSFDLMHNDDRRMLRDLRGRFSLCRTHAIRNRCFYTASTESGQEAYALKCNRAPATHWW